MDLTTLSDDEAKHVWEVIQRDFNLRKMEEERLGELKSKIDKEDSKMELLGPQSTLVESHCIRCLQPFKFLVNSRRQCIDCKLYTCKTCSRYSKKEHGWVCDPCRMTRVLKIGTVGWYHDNVRTRFKRFGSAKVMKSLYKRLNGDGGRRDSDTQSMPDFRNDIRYHGYDEDYTEAEAQRHKLMRKNKRLLSVHPMDLDVDIEEYLQYPTLSHPRSRRPSIQEERGGGRGGGGGHTEHMDTQQRHIMSRRRSLDRYNIRSDDGHYGTANACSLSKISSTVSRQQYVDTSDEEEAGRCVMYQPRNRRRPSYGRGGSHENLQVPLQPPITELNERMSAIESLLNRLESKITAPDDEPNSPTAAQIEEENLRRKLSELAGKISVPSSDEEAGGEARKTPVFNAAASRTNPTVLPQRPLSSSSDEGPTEAQRVYMTSSKSSELEQKLRRLEHSARNRLAGATDSDLSELEDVVSLTAQRVQSTESEVSDLESKLAALNALGKKKITGSQNRKRFNQDIPTKTSNGSGPLRKSNHVKN
ncbi:hypothetical protein DPEC_G00153340 [Dallia pectoralis]|uniref:Uncharacterized protein n=1 Tax=Dallia pectoralis TaxID=75939 RepID=A0ACC2GJJ0_DALPE|nr:hypothetical protein DPEC_G00153340 [Dallia pectoralis]